MNRTNPAVAPNSPGSPGRLKRNKPARASRLTTKLTEKDQEILQKYKKELQRQIREVDDEIDSTKGMLSEKERKKLKKEKKKKKAAATKLQAMVRGFLVWNKWRIPRLEAKLARLEKRRVKDVKKIKREHKAAKKEFLAQAEEEAKRNRLRQNKVGEQSELIDHFRQENAQIRAANKQLHKNIANLRINNERIEENMNDGGDYHEQLKVHHQRVSNENEKLAKFEETYRKKLDDLETDVADKTAWAQYEHKVKRAYARAIFCAVEMVRDTYDEELLANVEEMTTLLDAHSQTWIASPFDDYRPKRKKANPDESTEPDEMDAEVDKILAETKETQAPTTPKKLKKKKSVSILKSPKTPKSPGSPTKPTKGRKPLSRSKSLSKVASEKSPTKPKPKRTKSASRLEVSPSSSPANQKVRAYLRSASEELDDMAVSKEPRKSKKALPIASPTRDTPKKSLSKRTMPTVVLSDSESDSDDSDSS